MANPEPRRWLNSTVLGAGLTSLLSDLSYETAFAVLPAYLKKIGATTASLGLIEGLADALASFVKLGSGFWSDRFNRRKPFALVGYSLTAVMPVMIAVAVVWPVILLARLIGWFGKGLRGPARDALLAASVPPEHRGKAFGLHRAGDTVGAILGPLLAAGLLRKYGTSWEFPERNVIWAAVPAGVLAALAFALLVKETRGAAVKHYTFGDALRQMPPDFRRFLVGVGIFGSGDFSHVLLIAMAGIALTPSLGAVEAASWAAMFYAIRNTVGAVSAFPVGALSDRIGRRGLLIAGYFLAAGVMVGFAMVMSAEVTNLIVWGGLFGLAGLFIAIEESLESAMAADLVPDLQWRGTAFGVLGVVNGCGDFISSTVVGYLFTVHPVVGFAFAAVLMAIGAGVLLSHHRSRRPPADAVISH
jgi:MFS family permease